MRLELHPKHAQLRLGEIARESLREQLFLAEPTRVDGEIADAEDEDVEHGTHRRADGDARAQMFGERSARTTVVDRDGGNSGSDDADEDRRREVRRAAR